MMYDLIVIGGGPAGLAASLYAARKKLAVLLVSPDLGGRTNQRLALPWVKEDDPAWTGLIRGLELVEGMRQELEASSIPRRMEGVESVRKTDDGFTVSTGERGGTSWETRAVIIAAGTRHVPLDIPGEREYLMRGVSYSALSYAPFFENRSAAVIGEGELAIRSAAELSTLASQVYLVCSQGEMLSQPLGQKLRSAANVKILEGYAVQEIQGEGAPGEGAPGAGYARCLVLISPNGNRERLEIDGIFVERGLVPNSNFVSGLVHTDAAGRIRVDASARTSTPGIFAAGDVTNLYAEQIPVAVGEGVKAALSAYDYLLPEL